MPRPFIAYATEKSKSKSEELSYRTYVTDCLAGLLGGGQRWVDSVTPQEDIDAEAVIDDVIKRAGLEVT